MSDEIQITGRYSWRSYNPGGDAQVVGDTLNVIAQAENLALHSVPIAAVIEHARNEDSPLHRYFEWDDTEAARKFRMVQARRIITSIEYQVVRMGGEVSFTVPAYVAIRGNVNVYTPTSEAMAETKREIAILNDARNGLMAWMRRFDVLQRIPGLDVQFDAMIEQIDEYILKQDEEEGGQPKQLAA